MNLIEIEIKLLENRNCTIKEAFEYINCLINFNFIEDYVLA